MVQNLCSNKINTLKCHQIHANPDYAACGCKILIVYCYLKFQCLYQAYQADPEALTQCQLQFCGLGENKCFKRTLSHSVSPQAPGQELELSTATDSI